MHIHLSGTHCVVGVVLELTATVLQSAFSVLYVGIYHHLWLSAKEIEHLYNPRLCFLPTSSQALLTTGLYYFRFVCF